MDKNTNRVLIKILDRYTIYTKYLNQTNNVNKQYNQIKTIALDLKQKLVMSNNKKTKAITLLKTQIAKLNQ